jgi:hypothetical protein
MKKYIMLTALALVFSAAAFSPAQAVFTCAQIAGCGEWGACVACRAITPASPSASARQLHQATLPGITAPAAAGAPRDYRTPVRPVQSFDTEMRANPPKPAPPIALPAGALVVRHGINQLGPTNNNPQNKPGVVVKDEAACDLKGGNVIDPPDADDFCPNPPGSSGQACCYIISD